MSGWLIMIAYSITSAYPSNGVCITTSGARIPLSSAYSEILPSANGRVTLDANGQQSFIDYLGFSSCSGGGVSIVPTALIQVTNTTTTQTSTLSNVPLAAIASFTIAPVSLFKCPIPHCHDGGLMVEFPSNPTCPPPPKLEPSLVARPRPSSPALELHTSSLATKPSPQPPTPSLYRYTMALSSVQPLLWVERRSLWLPRVQEQLTAQVPQILIRSLVWPA